MEEVLVCNEGEPLTLLALPRRCGNENASRNYQPDSGMFVGLFIRK